MNKLELVKQGAINVIKQLFPDADVKDPKGVGAEKYIRVILNGDKKARIALAYYPHYLNTDFIMLQLKPSKDEQYIHVVDVFTSPIEIANLINERFN